MVSLLYIYILTSFIILRSVECGICPTAAVCTSVEILSLKSMSRSFNNLELLALNAQKFTSSRDPDHAPVLTIFFRGHVGTVPGAYMTNLKSA